MINVGHLWSRGVLTLWARESDWTGCSLAISFKGVSIAQRSTRQARLLLACRVNLEHLLVQSWPILRWGRFNNTLQVMVVKHIFKKLEKIYVHVDLAEEKFLKMLFRCAFFEGFNSIWPRDYRLFVVNHSSWTKSFNLNLS